MANIKVCIIMGFMARPFFGDAYLPAKLTAGWENPWRRGPAKRCANSPRRVARGMPAGRPNRVPHTPGARDANVSGNAWQPRKGIVFTWRPQLSVRFKQPILAA